MDQTKSKSKVSDEIIEIAKKRFQIAQESESENRRLALEDLEFRAGKQWPDDVIAERQQDGRPCLVINRIPQHVRQITNDQRQNRPSIKVSPVDDKADVETAKIFQGLARHIEYSSNADTAYDTAFHDAVIKGLGYFRIVTDYCSPTSFEQELKFERIKNSFSVYIDPMFKEPDGSDMNWAFISKDYDKDDYMDEHGGSDLAKMDDWSSIGDKSQGWASENTCRVVEYFYKDWTDGNLYQLSDGQSVLEDQLENALMMAAQHGQQLSVTDKRKTKIPQIKWLKINGIEILEETIWPGQWIPIVPVMGDELDVNGKRVLEGIVRHAKDSQRMYNFWASNETETIALAPKAPFIAAEGQIPREYEAQWKNANRKNAAFLVYKPISLSGQVLGAPQRNVYEPAVQAITNARMMAAEDIKSTTGIYDASLGNRSNETSGVAIRNRSNQAQTSNFHFIDNLTRSIRHGGRILIDVIPKIYDTARAARILGDSGDQEIVFLNQIFEKDGKPVLYDLSKGKYDLTVETGPSFATKRQEALASMVDLTKAYPQIAQFAGDLMVKNMDWPGSQEIADRLKKMLPPQLIDDPNKQQEIPPQAKAQIDQMGSLIDDLTKHLNEKTEIIKGKQIEIESKERIEFAKLENALVLEQIKQQGAAANHLFKTELEDINTRLNLLRIHDPMDTESNESDEIHQNQMSQPQPQMPTDGPQSSGQPMEGM